VRERARAVEKGAREVGKNSAGQWIFEDFLIFN